MNTRHLFLALALVLTMPSAAWASPCDECPAQMAQVDELLASNPNVSDEDLAEAKALRASAESALNAGDGDKAKEDLAKAIALLDAE